MNVSCLQAAHRARVPGNTKVVLLVLAKHASSNEWIASRSINEISDESLASTKTVKRSLIKLKRAGLIKKLEAAPGTVVPYRVMPAVAITARKVAA